MVRNNSKDIFDNFIGECRTALLDKMFLIRFMEPYQMGKNNDFLWGLHKLSKKYHFVNVTFEQVPSGFGYGFLYQRISARAQTFKQTLIYDPYELTLNEAYETTKVPERSQGNSEYYTQAGDTVAYILSIEKAPNKNIALKNDNIQDSVTFSRTSVDAALIIKQFYCSNLHQRSKCSGWNYYVCLGFMAYQPL